MNLPVAYRRILLGKPHITFHSGKFYVFTAAPDNSIGAEWTAEGALALLIMRGGRGWPPLANHDFLWQDGAVAGPYGAH